MSKTLQGHHTKLDKIKTDKRTEAPTVIVYYYHSLDVKGWIEII